MKSAAVIPTFNEGGRVLSVADAALASPNIGHVIVVNDGSTDNTGELLASRPGLITLTHDDNVGKGEALDSGMQCVADMGYESAVFLDADLKGIRPDHMGQLLRPIIEQDDLMTIGYLGLRKSIVKKLVLSKWGALGGQRAIQTEVWDRYMKPQDKHGYKVEAAMIARLRKANDHSRIARVTLDGVSHVSQHEKQASWPKALRAYGKIYGQALQTYVSIQLEPATPLPDF